MQIGEDDETSLIFSYFQKFQKQQIHMCIFRHPDFRDFINVPTSERHFKHLWNEIVKMMQEIDSFQKYLSVLHDFTLFTPIYSRVNLKYMGHPERLQQIAQRCIAQSSLSVHLFHIFVQILTPHDPNDTMDEVLGIIKTVLTEYENHSRDASVLRRLYNFFYLLQRIETEQQARDLIDTIDYYLNFRETSQNIARLSSTQYSRILITIFDKLPCLTASMIRILKFDPLIFSFLITRDISKIDEKQLPPFSEIVKAEIDTPKSFYMRYRALMLPIINLFLLFSNFIFSTDEQRNQKLILAYKVFAVVNSGPAGKDAFVFIFLHFLRNDPLSLNIHNFVHFLQDGEHKASDSKDLLICSFVFSFDIDIFPSTISLLGGNFVKIIINTLQRLTNQYKNSPFKNKLETVYSQFSGFPILTDPVERASQLAHGIWINGKIESNVTDILVTLKQHIIHPNILQAFLQVSYAFFAKNHFAPQQVPFYCQMAATIFGFGNNLPDWHFFSLRKEKLIGKMAESLDIITLLTRITEGMNPKLVLGALLLLPRVVLNEPENFSLFAAVNYSLLPLLIRKISTNELPEATRALMRFFEACPDMSVECIHLSSDFLVDTAKRGYRNFIRFAMPLFRNEYFMQQIVIRGYFEQIIETLIKFANGKIETTRCFMNLWRSLGTVLKKPQRSEKFAEILKTIIDISSTNIKGGKNEFYFYNCLFDVTIVQGEIFLTSLRNLQPEPELLRVLLVKLPRGIAISLTKKMQTTFEGLDFSNNPESILPKWIPWPIDDSIYEVTGIVHRAPAI